MTSKKLLVFDLDDTLYQCTDVVKEDYSNLNQIQLFPGVLEILKSNQCVLVTRGDPKIQLKKLDILNIKPYFDSVMVCPTDPDKKPCFEKIKQTYPEHQIWVIGDRVDAEIKFGNELKLKTILFNYGKYQDLQTEINCITNYQELNNLLNKIKVVILAAGKGTRMLPLTENIPKVLIPINGKPFLSYLINNLQQAGYNDFGIIAGYQKEKITEFIKNNNINAEIIEQKEQLGTGHALMQAVNFVDGENFLLVNGDNIFSVNDLKNISQNNNFNYISGREVNNPQKYGVLVTENNNLKKIVEKPQDFVGNLVNTGLYKFTGEIFTALTKIKKSERNEYELTCAISILAEENKVRVKKLENYWLDLSSKEDIPKVEEFLRKL